MKKYRCVVSLLAGLLICVSVPSNVVADSMVSDEAMAAIKSAESAVAQARSAIEKGKGLLALVPEDSPYIQEVANMLQVSSSNWKTALSSLDTAKQCSEKVVTTTNEALAQEWALLTKSNAMLALSNAQVVQIGLAYVEAVADNKTESLDAIESAMNKALASSSQVKLSHDNVKKLIAEKHSN